jgi:hypothetical protein
MVVIVFTVLFWCCYKSRAFQKKEAVMEIRNNVKQTVNNVNENDLKVSYNESRKKLIPLITESSEPNKHIKLQKLQTVFQNSRLWEAQHTKSGHAKFIHKVTKTPVEYQAHIKGKQNEIDPGIQKQVVEQLQKHVNILGNDIFYIKNWKTEPNYPKVIKNYEKWSKN